MGIAFVFSFQLRDELNLLTNPRVDARRGLVHFVMLDGSHFNGGPIRASDPSRTSRAEGRRRPLPSHFRGLGAGPFGASPVVATEAAVHPWGSTPSRSSCLALPPVSLRTWAAAASPEASRLAPDRRPYQNHGNSGGPLGDGQNGRVIGMNTPPAALTSGPGIRVRRSPPTFRLHPGRPSLLSAARPATPTSAIFLSRRSRRARHDSRPQRAPASWCSARFRTPDDKAGFQVATSSRRSTAPA